MRINLLIIKYFTSQDVRARRFVTTSAALATNVEVDGTVVQFQSQSFGKHRRPGAVMRWRHHQLDQKPSLRLFHSTTQLFFSNNSNDSGAQKHQLFLQQLQELESERTSLFGSMKDDAPGRSSTPGTPTPPDFISYINDSADNDVAASSAIHSDTYEDQSTKSINTTNDEDLKSDREALYGFTNEERNAWSTIGANNSTNHATMLRDIALARQQQQLGEEIERRSIGIKVVTTDTNSAKIELAESVTTKITKASSFSHLTQDQKQIHMVDVGGKAPTRRTAVAQSMVIFPPEVLAALNKTEAHHQTFTTTEEWIGPKGPIFATAITAGIMGVKQTSSLIPLCHPLPIEKIHIDISWHTSNSIQIKCTCSVTHKTGVEMEALMGCSIAALTIYDMVKAISHNVQITDTKLLYKDGGKRHVDER